LGDVGGQYGLGRNQDVQNQSLPPPY